MSLLEESPDDIAIEAAHMAWLDAPICEAAHFRRIYEELAFRRDGSYPPGCGPLPTIMPEPWRSRVIDPSELFATENHKKGPAATKDCASPSSLKSEVVPERRGESVAPVSRGNLSKKLMNANSKQIGERLRESRIKAAWSQGQLAEALNKAKSGICNVECGHRNITLTAAICAQLNISEEWVTTGAGEMFDSPPPLPPKAPVPGPTNPPPSGIRATGGPLKNSSPAGEPYRRSAASAPGGSRAAAGGDLAARAERAISDFAIAKQNYAKASEAYNAIIEELKQSLA